MVNFLVGITVITAFLGIMYVIGHQDKSVFFVLCLVKFGKKRAIKSLYRVLRISEWNIGDSIEFHAYDSSRGTHFMKFRAMKDDMVLCSKTMSGNHSEIEQIPLYRFRNNKSLLDRDKLVKQEELKNYAQSYKEIVKGEVGDEEDQYDNENGVLKFVNILQDDYKPYIVKYHVDSDNNTIEVTYKVDSIQQMNNFGINFNGDIINLTKNTLKVS